MSSFVKKVLIEKGELDRLQQRQIRDYSPELHNMAVLRNQIAEILGNKNMPDADKLSLLSTYQSHFNKLQKDTGIPSTGVLSAKSSDANVASKTKHTVKTNKSTADSPESDESNVTGDDQETEPDELLVDDKPRSLSVQSLGIQRMYEPKASKLLSKITEHPDILSRNDAGEIVVLGKAEPGTNFDNLFKSMVARNPNLNQPGLDKFLEALRNMGVRSSDLSSRELQVKYSPPAPAGTSKFQLAALKAEPLSISKVDSADKNYKAKATSSSTSSSISTIKRKKDQSGTGLTRPPGQRPKILYVY